MDLVQDDLPAVMETALAAHGDSLRALLREHQDPEGRFKAAMVHQPTAPTGAPQASAASLSGSPRSKLEETALWLMAAKADLLFPSQRLVNPAPPSKWEEASKTPIPITKSKATSASASEQPCRVGKEPWDYNCSLADPKRRKTAEIETLPRIRLHPGCVVKGRVVGFAVPSSILISVDYLVDWNGISVTYQPVVSFHREMRGVCDQNKAPKAAAQLRPGDTIHATVLFLDEVGSRILLSVNPKDTQRRIPSIILGQALPPEDGAEPIDGGGSGGGGGSRGSGTAGSGAGAGASSQSLPLPPTPSLPSGKPASSCSAIIATETAWLNPHSMDALQSKWIDNPAASLTRRFHGVVYNDGECYQALRKRQDANLSMEHVTSGHGHHQAGRSAEAQRSYNRALQVWRVDHLFCSILLRSGMPENPDALVCRGALFTKRGDFASALADLKAARRLDPHHVNATAYLEKTFLRRGNEFEMNNKLQDAVADFSEAAKLEGPQQVTCVNHLERISKLLEDKETLNKSRLAAARAAFGGNSMSSMQMPVPGGLNRADRSTLQSMRSLLAADQVKRKRSKREKHQKRGKSEKKKKKEKKKKEKKKKKTKKKKKKQRKSSGSDSSGDSSSGDSGDDSNDAYDSAASD